MPYVRKYAGPLQPGKRSAYVKGSRYNVRYARKGKFLPSRLRVSKTRTMNTKAISKALTNIAENKFQGTTQDCLKPVSKPAGTQPITYLFLNTGGTLQYPEFAPLNLFNFPQGDGNTDRTGNNMYIRKSHLKMEIQMLPYDSSGSQGLNPTMDFRFMIVKANRKYNQFGKSPDPGASLFINTQNDQFGYDGLTAITYLNMSQPINKRKWLVYKDMKFTLTPPSVVQPSGVANEGPVNTSSQKYPVKKYITINLPVYKKCHFDNDTNEPDNLDSQWLIVVQAVPSSYCTTGTLPNKQWSMNLLGTTSASDM